MPRLKKYLLTVDEDSGAPVRLEHVGDAGELTELPLSHLQIPVAGAQSPTVVVHVYGGTVASAPGATAPTASIIHAAAPASIIHQPAASIIHKQEPAPEDDK